MAKTYDSALNSLIDDHLADWARYLAERAGIPAGPATALETDLSGSLQADRLFRVAGPVPGLIHLELESSSRLGVPERLLAYNVAAWRANGEPVRSVLMLLRPAAQASDQSGRLTLSQGATPYLTFDYVVLRVWQESPEALLAAGPGLAPLAMVTDAAGRDLAGTLTRLDDRLRQPDVPGIVRKDLLNSAFILSGLRHKPEAILELYRSYVVTLEDSSTYMWILNKGEARGQLKGIAIGKAEALQASILKLGTKRFGPPPPALAEAIERTLDVQKLDDVADRLLDAAGWADLTDGLISSGA